MLWVCILIPHLDLPDPVITSNSTYLEINSSFPIQLFLPAPLLCLGHDLLLVTQAQRIHQLWLFSFPPIQNHQQSLLILPSSISHIQTIFGCFRVTALDYHWLMAELLPSCFNRSSCSCSCPCAECSPCPSEWSLWNVDHGMWLFCFQIQMVFNLELTISPSERAGK